MRVEINNKAINNLLPAKVQTMKSIGTQLLPKHRFTHCHLPTHLSCTNQFGWSNGLARNDGFTFHNNSAEETPDP